MKKTLSLILALLMSASCAATIFADEAVATSAIAEDAPAAEEVVAEAETKYDLAIEFLVNKKIMRGMTDGLLHAERPVKRYEMAILASRIATGWVKDADWMNGDADNTKFTDLEGSGAKDALGALSYANQNGLVVGYGDGTFKPENTVTYRDALTIAVRTLGYTTPAYPWGMIEKAVSLGLTEGISGVAYTDTIDRGVAAQIIYNALFAKTASNKTLAMESFNCEYGWEKIVVVANDKVTYTADANTTKKEAGVVAFKLVNDNGTFSAETFYVKANLAFGGFYNALFMIDKDSELVNLEKALPIDTTVVSNRGNDLETEYAITSFLDSYTLVEKYNVKNLSKTTLYDTELILQREKTETIITGWNKASNVYYAFDWVTGDILKCTEDDKGNVTSIVEWNYNSEFGYYFKKIVKETEDGEKLIGYDMMDEADVAALKDAIKMLKAETKDVDAYITTLDKPGKALYADLYVTDLDNNGTADYATYEKYQFGTYSGTESFDCGDHKASRYVFNTGKYNVAGSCGENYAGYTWAEGFAPSEGYTGYVIYGVDKVAHELKIVKEFPAYSADLTEDSYVAYGIVRAFNADDKKVTIGNDVYSWNIENISGVDAASADYYGDLFNQFVKFVVLDGKIAHIELSGNTSSNYIVVEKYLGVDNDGYIVVLGYTTDTCKIDEFRIGAYDGWKQGSGFFYADAIALEDEFDKGDVYKITSVDTTETNGKVYYVTNLGAKPADLDAITISVEDNYRTITIGTADPSTKRLNVNDKYVIIGVKNQLTGLKPVYVYTGIASEDWTVTGKVLAKGDNLWIITDATNVVGFNADSYNVGFVAFASTPDYKKVGFDGYVDNYYYYGATEYTVKGWNLFKGDFDTYTGYNLDIAKDNIYVTLDNEIVNTVAANGEEFNDGMTWAEFWREAKKAYADLDNKTADYYFFEYNFDKDTDKVEISKEKISSYIFSSGNKYSDLVDSLIVNTVSFKDGDLKINDAADKIDWDVVETVKAYCIYRAADTKVVVYLSVGEATAPVVAKTEAPSATKIEVVDGEKVYINSTATLGSTKNDKGGFDYTIDALTFNFEGDDLALMNHNTIAKKGYFFGETGECSTESWNVTVDGKNLFDKKADVTVYGDKHEAGVDCDLINSITITLAEKVALTAEPALISVAFDCRDTVGVLAQYDLQVCAWVEADGDIVYGFVDGYDHTDGDAIWNVLDGKIFVAGAASEEN